MPEVKWYRFWNPQSGFRGGLIIGGIIGIIIGVIMLITHILSIN